jgi:hypothetical protein
MPPGIKDRNAQPPIPADGHVEKLLVGTPRMTNGVADQLAGHQLRVLQTGLSIPPSCEIPAHHGRCSLVTGDGQVRDDQLLFLVPPLRAREILSTWHACSAI